MNQDVVDLILEYKADLDETQACIDLMNERYNSLVDLSFGKYEHVLMFVEMLEQEISASMFICFENRCPQCFDMEIGHYSYNSNESLTLGVLLEFIRHLKNEGILCEHEIVENINVSSIITSIRLKTWT